MSIKDLHKDECNYNCIVLHTVEYMLMCKLQHYFQTFAQQPKSKNKMINLRLNDEVVQMRKPKF